MARPMITSWMAMLAALAISACESSGSPAPGLPGPGGGASGAEAGNGPQAGGGSGGSAQPPDDNAMVAGAGGGSAQSGAGGVGNEVAGGGGTSGSAGAGGAATGGAAGNTAQGGAGAAGLAGAGGDGDMADDDMGGGPNMRPARVLLYSFSTLNINSVPRQLTLLSAKLGEWGYEVDTSVDPAVFSDESLAKYAAVGMINTCFSPFGANASGQSEAEALQRFLQDGGGLFGTHCADVTFQNMNPPHLYNELIGGRASSQNFEGTSSCTREAEHPAAAGLPDTFDYNGNLDGTNYIADDSEILVRCTWGNGMNVAVSWTRSEGPGRVFFTNMAKEDVDYSDPIVGEAHLFAGLQWVLGL